MSDIITLTTIDQEEARVKVLRETAKAIQVEGNASRAWFPKSAIDSNGEIAGWFTLSISHCFLFDAPFTGEE